MKAMNCRSRNETRQRFLGILADSNIYTSRLFYVDKDQVGRIFYTDISRALTGNRSSASGPFKQLREL